MNINRRSLSMNKAWHQKNKMPKNPKLEDRIRWHKEHAKTCACRPIPENLLKVINSEEK